MYRKCKNFQVSWLLWPGQLQLFTCLSSQQHRCSTTISRHVWMRVISTICHNNWAMASD